MTACPLRAGNVNGDVQQCPHSDDCMVGEMRWCRLDRASKQAKEDPGVIASQKLALGQHVAANRHFTSEKRFSDYPCAHRQWRHPGHCRFIHGYSRSFRFVFMCQELDENGWVLDFSDLKWLKDYLDKTFDHTLLIAADDPQRASFELLHNAFGCQLVMLPYGPSMEGTARHLCEYAEQHLNMRHNGRVRVVLVEARENDKNAATFYNPFLHR